MAKLEITLHEKGGDVTYKEHHISGQKYLDLLNMQQEFDRNDKFTIVEIIKKRLEFTAGLFQDSNVTVDTILSGTDPWDLVPTLDRLQRTIIGVEDSTEKKE